MLLWSTCDTFRSVPNVQMFLGYEHLTPAWTRLGDPRVRESRTITAELVLKSRKSCRPAG